ncbi:MAG TPA: helix-turn-helix domain-containing protein [Pyrinomonadaceae bacterium]|jgi:DNA-binding NtrC family response regulator
MSDRKVLRIDKLRRFTRGPKADLRLQLLAVKDLAALFLEELEGAFDSEDAATGPQGHLAKLYSGAGVNYYQELRRFEIELIRCALALTGGKQTAAAQLLGLKPTTLNTKIKQFKIGSE